MLKLKHTLIIIFIILAFLYNLDFSKFKLGLDLKGGSSLLFSTEDHSSKFIKSLRSNISHILDKNDILLEDLSISIDNGEIVVNLRPFDYDDVSKVQDLLLEFNFNSVLNDNEFTIRYSKEYLSQDLKSKMNDLVLKIKNRLDQYGLSEPYVIKEGQNKIYIELPGVVNINELNNNVKLIKTPAHLSFQPVIQMSDRDFQDSYKGKNGVLFYKLGFPVVHGDNIISANTIFEDGNPGVSFKLDSIGAAAFADYTQDNIGKQLAIVLDGTVLSAPRISARIGGGQAQITGNYTHEETKLLAISLKSGSLPLDIELQETKLIGPSLGEKNIKYGILSMGIGFLLVLLFLLFYYKLNGLFILVALSFNIFLVFFIVYSFGFVLTLPGIAGVILTIGMAIDANIIIQERIRELLEKGEVNFLELGYKEAKVAIYDANITTILVGIILYSYGTGPLKSFALLLIVGILTSIYTSIYFTEEIQKYFSEKRNSND